MQERCKHQRFPLNLPTKIQLENTDGRQVLELVTRNVSASGALFQTEPSICEGTRVKLDLTLNNKRLIALTGKASLVRVKGQVSRSDLSGVAVCFAQDYEIVGKQ